MIEPLMMFASNVAVGGVLSVWLGIRMVRNPIRVAYMGGYGWGLIVSGVMLMGVGVLLTTNQLSWFNTHFTFLTDWVVAAEEMLQ